MDADLERDHQMTTPSSPTPSPTATPLLRRGVARRFLRAACRSADLFASYRGIASMPTACSVGWSAAGLLSNRAASCVQNESKHSLLSQMRLARVSASGCHSEALQPFGLLAWRMDYRAAPRPESQATGPLRPVRQFLFHPHKDFTRCVGSAITRRAAHRARAVRGVEPVNV